MYATLADTHSQRTQFFDRRRRWHSDPRTAYSVRSVNVRAPCCAVPCTRNVCAAMFRQMHHLEFATVVVDPVAQLIYSIVSALQKGISLLPIDEHKQ